MTRLRISRLGRDSSHRKHMFRTMVTQLFKHERIKTTLPKAMALRFPAERMITLAKTNTLQNALQLSKKFLREKEVVLKLLSVLKLRYLMRSGGYTRVHKCGYRKHDKAPMAYIELVDSPKEIGKRIEKRPKVYPTIEELREKAPTMDIYNKPVVHVSENKRTSLLGGMVGLLNRLRQIPIPTVTDIASQLVSPPDISVEFSNVPGPGQPREKEVQEAIAKSEADIKKNAKEVLEKRRKEQQDEKEQMRKLLNMDKKKAANKAGGNAAQKSGAKKESEATTTTAEGNRQAQQGKQQQDKQQPQQTNQQQHAKQQQQQPQHAKQQQGKQQPKKNKQAQKNKKQGKKK
jgi:large subunit ribosomal protein L17